MSANQPVLIASDHAGFEMKEALKKLLPGVTWKDLGPANADRVDYPDFAAKLGREIARNGGSSARGVLICGSGIGVSIAANKIGGVRAALVANPVAARLAREHNDANVLCLGARFVAPEYGAEIIQAWLSATFDAAAGGGRHAVRIEKIQKLEESK